MKVTTKIVYTTGCCEFSSMLGNDADFIFGFTEKYPSLGIDYLRSHIPNFESDELIQQLCNSLTLLLPNGISDFDIGSLFECRDGVYLDFKFAKSLNYNDVITLDCFKGGAVPVLNEIADNRNLAISFIVKMKKYISVNELEISICPVEVDSYVELSMVTGENLGGNRFWP